MSDQLAYADQYAQGKDEPQQRLYLEVVELVLFIWVVPHAGGSFVTMAVAHVAIEVGAITPSIIR